LGDILYSTHGAVSNIYLYADDAKIFKHIQTLDDRSSLQNMFNNVQLWIDKWQLSLNFDDCVTVSYGRHIHCVSKKCTNFETV